MDSMQSPSQNPMEMHVSSNKPNKEVIIAFERPLTSKIWKERSKAINQVMSIKIVLSQSSYKENNRLE